MAHGGARQGAGRKAGSANKKTREIADKAASEGETPLEFMLKMMRDVTQPIPLRAQMATSAAPYVHPRLSSVDAKVEGEVGLKVEIVRFGDNPASK